MRNYQNLEEQFAALDAFVFGNIPEKVKFLEAEIQGFAAGDARTRIIKDVESAIATYRGAVTEYLKTFETDILTVGAKRDRIAELIKSTSAKTTAFLDHATQENEDITTRLRGERFPARPESATDGSVMDAKSDLRIGLDVTDRTQDKMLEYAGQFAAEGNRLMVWLLTNSDWAKLYLDSREGDFPYSFEEYQNLALRQIEPYASDQEKRAMRLYRLIAEDKVFIDLCSTAYYGIMSGLREMDSQTALL